MSKNKYTRPPDRITSRDDRDQLIEWVRQDLRLLVSALNMLHEKFPECEVSCHLYNAGVVGPSVEESDIEYPWGYHLNISTREVLVNDEKNPYPDYELPFVGLSGAELIEQLAEDDPQLRAWLNQTDEEGRAAQEVEDLLDFLENEYEDSE